MHPCVEDVCLDQIFIVCIAHKGYVSSAFPVMLHIAYKYGDEDSPGAVAPSSGPFERSILASTNAGGENLARGSLLGALLGARYGLQGIPPGLRDGLLHAVEIGKEAKDFSDVFLPIESCEVNGK